VVLFLHPASSKGRLISVMRRGAGCGGRCGTQDVRRAAEAQAAMIRPTGRGSPAEDSKTSRPAMPVNGVCPPGLSQSKPINTARGTPTQSAVRGDCNLMRFHISRMGPWAWLTARRSARPWVYPGLECEIGIRARPRRLKNEGRRSFALIPPHRFAGGGTRRARRWVRADSQNANRTAIPSTAMIATISTNPR
jgi:hypothetical protein